MVENTSREEIERARQGGRDEMREPMPKEICPHGHAKANLTQAEPEPVEQREIITRDMAVGAGMPEIEGQVHRETKWIEHEPYCSVCRELAQAQPKMCPTCGYRCLAPTRQVGDDSCQHCAAVAQARREQMEEFLPYCEHLRDCKLNTLCPAPPFGKERREKWELEYRCDCGLDELRARFEEKNRGC